MNAEVNIREITAAVVRSQGAPFTIEQARLRAPQGDEVLVRVVATGLCHTDLIVRDQYYPVPLPAVLGHEGAGVVEALGPNVKDLKVGDHVVLTYGACGHCHHCDSGHGAYCKDFFGLNFGGSDLQGNTAITDPAGAPLHDHFFAQSSFASYALSRENNAVKVPADAPLELLGPLGCGIQTGAGAVINSLKVGPGSSFVSLGAGAVGLSAVLAARVADGSWERGLEGEVWMLAGSRSVFGPEPCSDTLARRLATFDIHPTGPQWGQGELRAQGVCAALELRVLSEADGPALRAGLEAAGLKQERRALRQQAVDLRWTWLDRQTLELGFALAPGSYATALLHELGPVREANRSA